LEQVALFSDSGKRDVFIRSKKKKKESFNNEELRIIEMRKKLMSVTVIRDRTYYSVSQISGILKRKFKFYEDPFNKHIANLISNGKTINDVCAVNHIPKGSVSRICKAFGVVPVGMSYNGKIKKKKIDYEQFSKDLYCYYLDGMSVKEIGVSNGYSNGGFITVLFGRFIKSYKGDSKNRREKSCEKSLDKKRNRLSVKYKNEREFQFKCCELLSDAAIKYDEQVGINGCIVDVVTKKNVIELKTTGRKVDIYRAIGQVLCASHNNNKRPIICIPSDLSVCGDMKKNLMAMNIILCTEIDLIKQVNG
jgi:hypothetical protein